MGKYFTLREQAPHPQAEKLHRTKFQKLRRVCQKSERNIEDALVFEGSGNFARKLWRVSDIFFANGDF